LLSSSLATWQQLFGQDKHRWAFVGYLVHLLFNRQRFRADDFQIPQHRQALFVIFHEDLSFKNRHIYYTISNKKRQGPASCRALSFLI